ncbi:MAG: hypothetical protein HOI23_06305 [Deltaproteobacteria bacterium]|jgi:type I restriction enzyme, S subunit|nr:hypothetical protein [Deltaproteobacteria bacterium]
MEVKSGYKQTEVGVIPEDWEMKAIGQIAPLQRGIDLPTSQVKEGPYPVVYSNGVMNFHNTAIARGPGVVTGRSGTLGKVHYVETDFWPHNTSLWVTRFNDNHPRFIFYLYSSIGFIRFASGSGVPTLNRNDAHAFRTALPPTKAEQEAIAEALSDADAFIESLEQLINKKRQVKQGAMQELLAGKKRLPGFSGEWQDLFVEDVVDRFFCGPSPTCEERNIIGDSEWAVLKTTAITWDNGWDWTKHKILPKVFWNQPHLEVKAGDVIVTKAGPRHRVGVAVWVNYALKRIIVSGKMIGLRPYLESIVPLMLAAAIASKEAQTFLDQRTTGMAESQVNFENTVLLRTPIRIPHIDEQNAIADILFDMDAEIATLEAKLTKIRQIKQGMMQELITGRIRLI